MERQELDEEQEVVGQLALKRRPSRRGISDGDQSLPLSEHELNIANNVTGNGKNNGEVAQAVGAEPEPSDGQGEDKSQSATKSVYLGEEDGAVSKNGTVGMAFSSVGGPNSEEIVRNEESDFPPCNSDFRKSLTIGSNQQAHENLKEGAHSMHLLFSETSVENGTATSVDKNDHIQVVKENKLDLTEWDVEKVLEEQETYDLFCPHCNSCITKRVILRKRKRKVRDIGDDPRRKKIEILEQLSAPTTGNQGSDTIDFALDGNTPPPNTNDQVRVVEPFIFRCLSCFSFFIPAVAGCKLFRIFREKSEDINMEGAQQRSCTNVPGEQGDNAQTHQESECLTKKHNDLSHVMVEKHEVVSLKSQKSSDNIWFSAKLEHSATGVEQKAVAVGKKGADMDQDFGAACGNDEAKLHGDKRNSEMLNSLPFSNKNLSFGMNSTILTVTAAQLPGYSYIGEQADDPKSEQGSLVPPNTLIDVEKNLKGYPGDDITIVVDERRSARGVANDTVSSEPSTLEGNQTEPCLDENRPDGARRFRKLKILKSIVYGGLIESITSLGVVSSAAGGDATTLNILALGLANLVAGLPIIAHNLVELKNEQYDATNRSHEVDRYEEVLGERKNFWIHAMVAVLSYLVFGIVPIVTYGFSFRKSDNKEDKLIAVAVVSLFCIILLAIGRAYVRKPPKSYRKTIVSYVAAGVIASGLSYVVGVLVKKLLEKLGLFEPSAAASAPPSVAFVEMIPRNPPWASY